MKLYKLTNKIDTYYVVAEDPTEAETKLMKILDDAYYSFLTSYREVYEIVLLGKQIKDKNSICGNNLVL